MLITNAVLLDGSVVDLRVGHLIEDVANNLEPRAGEAVLDASHSTVLPGLHDHHVHLRSAAAALGSVRVGPPQVRSRADFARALASAHIGEDGWIRAIGYHDSVAGHLDRALLDSLSPQVPIRVQHRSGALWTFNSTGLAHLGMANVTDGRVHRVDTPVHPTPARRTASLRPLSETLAAWGVTGVTDATPGYGSDDIKSFSAARQSGDLMQRCHCMALPGVQEIAGISLGPVKRILDDDSLDLEALQQWISACHDAGRPVAVHCVTAAQLVVTIAAVRAAGVHPLDRIEHAAVVPHDCVDDLGELSATIVTQPNFVAERGDQYLSDTPPDDHDQLWRVASLRQAGIPVALSTDMPFGHGDPWAAMRAAVVRRTPSGVVLGSDESVSSIEALSMFLGQASQPAVPRTVAAGQPGDLCVLGEPPTVALAQLSSDLVVTTIVGGEMIWHRSPP